MTLKSTATKMLMLSLTLSAVSLPADAALAGRAVQEFPGTTFLGPTNNGTANSVDDSYPVFAGHDRERSESKDRKHHRLPDSDRIMILGGPEVFAM